MKKIKKTKRERDLLKLVKYYKEMMVGIQIVGYTPGEDFTTSEYVELGQQYLEHQKKNGTPNL